MGGSIKMADLLKRILFRTFAVMLCCGALTSCDLSTPTHRGDNSVIPSNLRRVSYDDLPGWREDDVRYALQAFRNSCRARIQYTGRVIPDRELFAEKCRMLPSASADVATIRAWFESNFQPYQVIDDNGEKRGLYTGYYSPIIPGCRTRTSTSATSASRWSTAARSVRCRRWSTASAARPNRSSRAT